MLDELEQLDQPGIRRVCERIDPARFGWLNRLLTNRLAAERFPLAIARSVLMSSIVLP